jgi:nucleoid-associated protein YgaU
LAESGSAPWKGLTVGGIATAVIVAFGLWVGGVFDPLETLEDVVAQGETTASTEGIVPVEPLADEQAGVAGSAVPSGSGDASGDAPRDVTGSAETQSATTTAGQGAGSDTVETQVDTASSDSSSMQAGATEGESTTTSAGADTAGTAPETTTETTTETTPETTTETAGDRAGDPAQAATETAGQSTDASTTDQAGASSESSTVTGSTVPGSTVTGADGDQVTPSFDIVRMEQDGAALVAGVAAPGSTVELLLNGVVVGTETAGSDGKFVSFLDIPQSDTARVLTLRMAGVAGAVASTQEVILGPTTMPAQAATQTAGSGTSDGGGAGRAALSETEGKAEGQVAEGQVAETGGQTDDGATRPEGTAVAQAGATDQSATTKAEPGVASVQSEPTVPVQQADNAASPATGAEVPATETSVSDGAVPEDGTADRAQAADTDAATGQGDGTTGTTAAQMASGGAAGAEGSANGTAGAGAQGVASQTTASNDTATTTDAAQSETEARGETQDAKPGEQPGATGGSDVPQSTTPTILLSDADGVKVLQAPGATGDEVALQAISYAADGSARVSGRGQPGGVVRAYLDDDFVTEARVAADGNWVLDLPVAKAGLLRIDEVSADGSVRSRIETAIEGATSVPGPEAAAISANKSPIARSATATVAPRSNRYAGITQVTVEKGSTLWAIAREKYGEGLMYVRVFEANRDLIRNPDLIYPGQVFNLPD